MQINIRAFFKPFYVLARESDRLNELEVDIKNFLNIYSSDLEKVLLTKSITLTEKMDFIKKITSNPFIGQLLYKCIKEDRIKLIPVIFKAWRKEILDSFGIIEGNVLTTTELSQEQLDKTSNKMGELLNKKVVLTPVIDNTIMGGIVVIIDDKTWDFSIKNGLLELIGRIEETVSKNMEKENIEELIKDQINDFEVNPKYSEEGVVISSFDGIVEIAGLNSVEFGELILFENGQKGMVLDLKEVSVGASILGEGSTIKEGMKVKRTKEQLSVPVGDALIGRVVDALGRPIDGMGEIKTTEMLPIERPAHGIMDRQSVDRPTQTGILVIDSLVPLGRGQRELIIGDRKVGKTEITIDTIINQKGKDMICIYVSIGQKNSKLANIVRLLKEAGALEYTLVVAANASSPDAEQYLSPFSGTSMGEYWMSKGKDVLIVYDDLSKHANSYRSISLLLRKPPGREAYPGDVFYLHSRLLERSAQLNDELGGGSMTSLPIIETLEGDISTYIPTNVISITDGQIFLSTSAFNSGQRPAIDAGLSVSRVGSSAQTKLIKKLSGSLKNNLASYEEIKQFAQFSSDLDETTKNVIETGQRIMKLLVQGIGEHYSIGIEATLLYLIKSEKINQVSMDKIEQLRQKIIIQSTGDKAYIDLLNKMIQVGDLTPEIEQALEEYTTNLIKNT